MTRIPTTGDRVKVIHPIAPRYFRGELGKVVSSVPNDEFVEVKLAGAQYPVIAHSSHLEVLP